jgi:hypothetical protein
MSKNIKKSTQSKYNPLYDMDFGKICKKVLTTPKPTKPKKNKGL